MFTGIIEEVGRVAALETTATGGTLRVAARKVLDRLGVGASIAVNGACLTATSLADGAFLSDLSRETLERTSFRTLKPGREVNLELPVTPTTPLGGHIVQGHVDGTGTFLGLSPAGEGNYWLDVDVPAELQRYLVEKGSVAVEGISLTVAAIEGTRLRSAIIPFTYENTNLRTLQPGDLVNLECDVLAKYLEKLLLERPPATPNPRSRKAASKLTLERLREEGF
ncbi:MAG: riboflavin synthase [Terriglobia bacterium]